MEQSALEEIMRTHLENLKSEQIEITNDTVLDTVLTDDGFGESNNKNLFRSTIRFTMRKAGLADKQWPFKWVEQTVSGLAEKLLAMLVLLFFSFAATSQINVSMGTGKTELRTNAINIALSYVKSLDSIWKEHDYFTNSKHSIFTISPEASIQTGNQDAFSSLSLKATGLLMLFKTTKIAGYETVNTSKVFHTFPFSVGAETNNLFNTINAIGEVGWVPWYRGAAKNLPFWVRQTKFGVFLQAGYKFYVDSTGKVAVGGAIDQSEEHADNAIFRAKSTFGINTKSLLKVNGLDIGLVGNGTLWYDFLNNCFYNNLDARARFYVASDKYIDMIYQKGSGAPNFNRGEQYGIAFTVTF